MSDTLQINYENADEIVDRLLHLLVGKKLTVYNQSGAVQNCTGLVSNNKGGEIVLKKDAKFGQVEISFNLGHTQCPIVVNPERMATVVFLAHDEVFIKHHDAEGKELVIDFVVEGQS